MVKTRLPRDHQTNLRVSAGEKCVSLLEVHQVRGLPLLTFEVLRMQLLNRYLGEVVDKVFLKEN